MGFVSWFKQWFVVHLIFGYMYITSGLIINFLMLLTMCFVWPVNKTLYRRIIDRLAWSLWSEIVFVTQYWSCSDCDLIIDEGGDIGNYIGKENAMIILNHKFDIDWLMGYNVCDKVNVLGSSKVYAKSSLSPVPLIGWTWYFTETIFVARDWNKDSSTIPQCIQKYKEYPPDLPLWILLFPEGTRFTKKKQELSNAVARNKGIPELKHHLLPRTKGFVESMKHLKGIVPAIYDGTVAFTQQSADPTLTSILNGKPCKAQIKVRRILLDDVPIDSDEDCANWLHELFNQKDEDYDEFLRNGKFQGKLLPLERRPHCLLNFIFWFIVLVVPLVIYLVRVFVAGSFILQVTALAALFAISVCIKLLISTTQIEKSSAYGNMNKDGSKKSK